MKVDIYNTNKKYNIIYADPAWTYKDKALAGNRGSICKYDVMNIEDIMNLPVKNISANDCILFMWVTMPKLNECNSLFWGMGRWTRANAELCLIATKGKPKRESAKVHSVIVSKIREHSRKPDEVREKIIELCGDLPRIELFARQSTERLGLLGQRNE